MGKKIALSLYIWSYKGYLLSVTTTSICLYIFILFLFPSRMFANGSSLENKISIAIMFKRLTARFVVVKNSVWGFLRMLISTFSFVIISVSSDTIVFWFSLAVAVVGGTASRNWAETYRRVLINFTNWKQAVVIQEWFHIENKFKYLTF